MAEKTFQWPGRRKNDAGHDMLAAFLVLDIQRNPEWARELSERLADVISGALPRWERIGNAYLLELKGQGAVLEDLVDEDCPVQKIPLDDFRQALNAWMAGLDMNPSRQSRN